MKKLIITAIIFLIVGLSSIEANDIKPNHQGNGAQCKNKREIRHDRREIRRDKKRLQYNMQHGNPVRAKHNARELRQDRRELRHDRRHC